MRIDECSRNEVGESHTRSGANFTNTGVAGKNESFE